MLGTLVAFGPAAVLAAPASASDTATGRNWEQVMPAQKAFPFGQLSQQIAVASVDGDSVYYQSYGPMSGSSSGSVENDNIARRAATGWANTPISPPVEQFPGRASYPEGQGVSEDLRHFVFKSLNPPLTPDAAPNVVNLYARDTLTGAYTLLSTVPGSGGAQGASPFLSYAGASSDFKRVVFEALDPLVPGAPSAFSPGAYEWRDGQIHLEGIRPDGTPAGLSNVGGGAQGANRLANAVSDDGRRVVFWDGGDVYVRVDDTSTLRASGSQRTVVDPNGSSGGALFWGASSDVGKVFLTSNRELTDDANTGDDGSGNPTDAGKDLYVYDTNTGDLTDLSVDANPADAAAGADVQGVVGVSDDGQYAYFVAHGSLAPGAVSGANNLYVTHAGQVAYIGALDGADSNAWGLRGSDLASQLGVPARVSPDGRAMIIQSVARLTAYDNTDPSSGTPTRQVYRYAADTGELTCVSCRPDGSAPSGNATITPPAWVANIPRNLSADGRRVFFDSADALVPEDTNGRTDVYEWADGKVALVSDGRSESDARFQDASADGNDVFFATRARLVSTDADDHYELYDARIGGGIPQPPVETPPLPCKGDGCQGAPATPLVAPVAATVVFTGPGNDPVPESRSSSTVKVTKPKAVTGTSATLKVRVSGKGSVTISGTGLGTVRRNATKASTLKVKVSLTKKARSTLRKRHTLKVTAKITFKPSGGKSASAKVALTFKQSKAKKTSKKGRS